MKKEMRELAKALETQGFEVRITRKGHVSVLLEGRIVAVFSGTPSDWRAMRNGISRAKRAGFIWPPPK